MQTRQPRDSENRTASLSRSERLRRTRFPASGAPKNPLRKRVALPAAHHEHPILLSYRVRSRVGAASDEWIGLVSNALEFIAYQCNPPPAAAPSRHPPGEKDKRIPGCFHYNAGNATNHPEVRVCPAALPAAPNWSRPRGTFSLRPLHHHIIRAAVAASVITEVEASAGPMVTVPRE